MATVNEPIIWREPSVFAAGDTLVFQRNLPNYLPVDGWSIQLSLTQPTDNGANLVGQWTSTPDTATGKFHTFNIPNFAGSSEAGIYILSEEIICSPTGAYPNEKHQIYYGELFLDPDLKDGLATQPVLSQWQQMKSLLWAKIQRLEAYDLTETDIQRSRFVVEERDKAWNRYRFVLEWCNYEQKQAHVANTGADPNRVTPVNLGGW